MLIRLFNIFPNRSLLCRQGLEYVDWTPRKTPQKGYFEYNTKLN